MTNEIGDLGEAIFKVNISRDYTFRTVHLGEKWPTADCYVELIGPQGIYFFIVQIKSTRQALDASGNLKVSISKEKLHLLNSYYCPTYLAGVDVNNQEVYMIPIHTNKRKPVNKLPSSSLLDTASRAKIYDDVKKFWVHSGIRRYKSAFKHSF